MQFGVNVVSIQTDIKCSCCCLFFVGLDKNSPYSETVGVPYVFTFLVENNDCLQSEAKFLCLSVFLEYSYSS